MSATEAIKVARNAGIEFTIDGDDLVLEAPAPPPAAVLDLLSRHKAEVVAVLAASTLKSAPVTEAPKLDLAAPPHLKPTKPGPGFVGYDGEGRFVHYCACGEWGSFGYDVSLRTGRLGTWYCRKHRPQGHEP
jgi:hypothetical protein